MKRISVSVLLFITLNCFSDDSFCRILQNKFEGYKLLHYRKGNFTNSKYDEYVIFLSRIYPENSEVEMVFVDKVAVVLIDNQNIKTIYEIKTGSISYDESEKYIITKNDLKFGEWDGYCYVKDFNNNGLDEILFFKSFGFGFKFDIYEFRIEGFKNIISSLPFNIISEVKTINKWFSRIIKVGGYNGNGNYVWYEYKWDSKKQEYIIIAQSN